MQPLHFGPPRCRLFGVHHEPQTDVALDASVVLCYPYGRDYVSAFRAYRSLATRLARVGFHVLRFDYRGTGDSEGDAEQGSLEQWIGDTINAVDELQYSCRHSSVSLVGLRLGATLAALAATENLNVDRLVLWEPVVDGAEYVETLRTLHQAWFRTEIAERRHARPLGVEGEVLGYRVTAGFRNDLEHINLWSLPKRPAKEVLIVGQHDNPDHARLARRLRELGSNVELKLVEGPTVWSMLPGTGEGLVPYRVVQTIVGWLASNRS